MKVQCIDSLGLFALSCLLVPRWGKVHASASDSTVFNATGSGSTGDTSTSSGTRSNDDDFTSTVKDHDFDITSSFTSNSSCYTGYFSDGECDLINNNERCGYDGGDCCECTCVSTDLFACGDDSNRNGGFACLDPSASCVDDDDVTTLPAYGSYSGTEYTGDYPSTYNCSSGSISDGFCNDQNNNEDCGYDGGDCCECTCKSTLAFVCGESDVGFVCVDPSGSSCDDDVDGTSGSDDDSFTSSLGCIPSYFADGDCDEFNNIEGCGYDDGDCCKCTCVSTEDYACGDDAHGGYVCLDPNADCEDDDDTAGYSSPYSQSEYTDEKYCATGWFSDGFCDGVNNNPDCGYDGGDCCACTCVSNDYFICGEAGYSCVDPDASCVDDDDVTSTSSSDSSASCIPEYYADGDCNASNNNENCGYDGGDCCECTCVTTETFTCGDPDHGGYACLDPAAPCVDDDDYTDDTTYNPEGYSLTTLTNGCIPAYVSDGDCDNTNNNEDCDYDGGDCCKCTCVDKTYICSDESHGGFVCIDPEAPCVDDDDFTAIPWDDDSTSPGYTATDACATNWASDGLCDPINNNEDCDYDGGDCCKCTCEDDQFTCGDGGWGCIDPRASCVDDDFYTTDSGDGSTGYTTINNCETGYISDGDCDDINNKADCEYDGGDCCECTCENTVDYTCGDGGFVCIDPDAKCVDINASNSYIDPEYTTELKCNTGWLSDGLCDSINNNEGCDYDGGDCCQCTCENALFACGQDGYWCLDPGASCLDDDDFTTSLGCIPSYISDAYCDDTNNIEACGYDGGDCCECTCDSNDFYTCGDPNDNGFDCIDPNGSLCFDDNDDSRFHPTDDFKDGDDIIFLTSNDFLDPGGDDIVLLPSDNDQDPGDASSSCSGDRIADGACDPDNNNEECGYDGGDCCECDCVSTTEHTCGDSGDFNCVEPSSACVNGYVEAGTKTTVGVSANAYDVRSGEASGGAGCQDDGCTPALSRDGVSADTESRWGCAQKLVPDGGVCQIEFTFEDPQDIMDVQVAFFKGDERSRTLEAAVNGEVIGNFDSYTGSTFNALGIKTVGVQTLTFTTVGLAENEWIGFIEVRFLVEP